MASNIYRNRMIINQRGGSITIDNTTEQEKVNISQRSGSNITIANHVTSELATNNKQTNVINDSFTTVWRDSSEFIGRKKIVRVAEDIIEIKGVLEDEQIAAYEQWKQTYDPIAKKNSQFKLNRGGVGYPNGASTPQSGSRAGNPVVGSKVFTVNNDLKDTNVQVGFRTNMLDTVAEYSGIKKHFSPAKETPVSLEDLQEAKATPTPSIAPLAVPLNQSPSTEGGNWSPNSNAANLPNDLVNIQPQLTPIEQSMGNGGDEIYVSKRNIFRQIGAIFNDFPSIRIDAVGRSQPSEQIVGRSGAFKNHDAVPLIEEVDNSTNFPCGNDDGVIGNRYSRTVGSGGIQLKSTGSIEMGGTKWTTGFKSVNMNASHGISMASESFVELQSVKSITLRTNNQVYVESALGVKGNAIIGGGAYVEGELFCQHITAPAEVHQTQDTQVQGQFATTNSRQLVIGEAFICGNFFPVYALATPNIITTYPHSHHHMGPPLRLTESNEGVRIAAIEAGINVHPSVAQSLPQVNERKTPVGFGTGFHVNVPLCFGGYINLNICGFQVGASIEGGIDINFNIDATVSAAVSGGVGGFISFCGLGIGVDINAYLGIGAGIGISFIGCDGTQVARTPGSSPPYIFDINKNKCQQAAATGLTQFITVPIETESEFVENEDEFGNIITQLVDVTTPTDPIFEIISVEIPPVVEPEELDIEPETDEFTESGDTVL